MSAILSRFKVALSLIFAFLIGFSALFSTASAAVNQPEPDTPLDKERLQKLSVEGTRRIQDGLKFDLGNYSGYVHVLSDDLIKVSILPEEQAEKNSPAIQVQNGQHPPAYSVRQNRGLYTISTRALTVAVHNRPFGIKVLDKNGQVINEDYLQNGVSAGYENGKPYVFKKTEPGENFYGFGEQTGARLNKRGRSMGMWNTDAYAYTNTTKYIYTTIPFFIGLKGGKAYGILFDNSYRSYYNMASESNNYYSFYANGGPLTYYFMYGPGMAHVVDQYTNLTGKIKLPPLWAIGLHQSSWGYTPDQITNVAKAYRDKNIPLDAMHFDIDYMNGFRVFTWKDDYTRARNKLKDMGGFHAVAINDPAVKKDPGYSVYDEGTAGDFWIKKPDGSPFVGPVWAKDSVFPNFLQSRVRSWWAEKVASVHLNSGVDGIWNDMNEPALFNDGPGFNHTLPLNTYGLDDQKSKVLHTEFHNYYGHLEDEATFKAWQLSQPNIRPFVLSRDMYAGTQRYAAVWTGDSVSDWEHLQMSLPMNMNVGLSGAAFVGNDIGGFAKKATPELFARWIELGAFLPYSRIHYDKTTDKSYSQEPWAFGSNVEKISKKYIEMRYQLLPYLYTAFRMAAQAGRPVQQPLVFQYQNDPNTYSISDQFMFGESMMAAPVVEPGKTSRNVYLPRGETWVNYWNEKEYKGGQTVRADAPLDTMPIFVKKNSIIPNREVQQYTGEKPLTNLVLDTRVDRAAINCFYEDDGKTLNYNKGAYNLTEWHVTRKGNVTEFNQIKKNQGFASALQSYTLKLNNAANPQTVRTASLEYRKADSLNQLNQQNSGFYFDSSNKVLYVKIPAGEMNKVTIH